MSDRQFLILCELLERPDLAQDPSLATNAQRVALRLRLLQQLADTLQHLEIDRLCEQLERAGLPYARVVRPDQLVNDEHLIASGGLAPMETDTGDIAQVVLLPLLMGGRRLGVRQALAKVGEHTQEVLGREPGPTA